MAKTAVVFLFLLCGHTLTAVSGDDGAEHPSCDVWSRIATQLTSTAGTQQSCHRGTEPCTRIDCKGAYDFSNKNSFLLPPSAAVEVDYCFGTVLNHCDDPISLDFYIQVPEKNVSKTTRVYHNTLLPIPGLRYNISNVGSAEAFLYFEMERPTGLNSVTFSVTVKVRLNSRLLGEVWPGSLQRGLISEETVPVPTCTPQDKLTVTSPPPTMAQCHPPHWKKGSAAEETEARMLAGNLGQTCSEKVICMDPWLVCHRPSFQCKCGQDYNEVSVKNGSFCSPKSHLGEACRENVNNDGAEEDCPSYMHVTCHEKKCVCVDMYTADYDRYVCELPPKPDGTSTTASALVTNAPHPSVAPHTGDNESQKGHSTAAVIAGSVIGGVVVLGGLLIVAYFAIRRLHGPYRNRELLLENDDSDGVM